MSGAAAVSFDRFVASVHHHHPFSTREKENIKDGRRGEEEEEESKETREIIGRKYYVDINTSGRIIGGAAHITKTKQKME